MYIDSLWRAFLFYFTASANKLYIFFDNVRILILCLSCTVQKPKTSVKFSSKSRNKHRFSRFLVTSAVSPRLYCYCFLSSLNMNQVPKKNPKKPKKHKQINKQTKNTKTKSQTKQNQIYFGKCQCATYSYLNEQIEPIQDSTLLHVTP